MIIEYIEKYKENVKDLLCELQEHIVNIDKEKYNIMSNKFREEYFKKTIKNLKENEGKMFLYVKDEKVLGLSCCCIYNEEKTEYDFCCPKRGYITELVVTKNSRNKGIGKELLNYTKKYLKEQNCKKTLIGVFAYNESAISFYKKNGYHERMIEMISED